MVRSTIWVFCIAACFFSSTASAARKDPFTELIRGRIEAFSDASSRGDQTAMNSLLAEEVLFASGSGTVDREPKLDKSDAIASLLKQQALNSRRYLAGDALVISEEGIVSGPRDHSVSASHGALTVTDWVVHESGDVAVASYIGEQATGHKSLSVETWIRSHAAWKLIASHSIPLYSDPPAVILPSDTLNDYAGTYTGGTGLSVVVSLDGSTLATSSNGGKPVAYQAWGRDVFFTPGLPPGTPRSRIAFQRDKSGHIAGYVTSRGLKLTRSDPATPQKDAAATQPGVSSTVLPAADLVVHRFGDVAIATFIHERVTHYYGQVLHAKYRSTETWMKRGTEWKMLALQSCELDYPVPSPLS